MDNLFPNRAFLKNIQYERQIQTFNKRDLKLAQTALVLSVIIFILMVILTIFNLEFYQLVTFQYLILGLTLVNIGICWYWNKLYIAQLSIGAFFEDDIYRRIGLHRTLTIFSATSGWTMIVGLINETYPTFPTGVLIVMLFLVLVMIWYLTELYMVKKPRNEWLIWHLSAGEEATYSRSSLVGLADILARGDFDNAKRTDEMLSIVNSLELSESGRDNLTKQVMEYRRNNPIKRLSEQISLVSMFLTILVSIIQNIDVLQNYFRLLMR